MPACLVLLGFLDRLDLWDQRESWVSLADRAVRVYQGPKVREESPPTCRAPPGHLDRPGAPGS